MNTETRSICDENSLQPIGGSYAEVATATTAPGARVRRACRIVVQLAALLAMVIAGVDLAGWALGIDALIRIVSHPAAGVMMPNTAVGFLFAGAALLLLGSTKTREVRRRAGALLASAGVLLGGLTLAEYFLQTDLGIDLLLFRDRVTAVVPVLPGRPSPMTALCFVCVGIALVLLDVRSERLRRVGRSLTIVVAALALQALIGYAYGEQRLWAPERALPGVVAFTPMAIHSAFAFLMVSLGLLCARPERGAVTILTGSDIGAVMARRLLPTVLVAAFVLGWLRLWGERAGLYQAAEGTSLFVVTVMLAVTTLIGWSTVVLRRLEEQRRRAEQALRQAEARLSGIISIAADGIITLDRDQHIILFNQGAERIFGYSAAEVMGQPHDILLPERFQMTHRQHIRAFAAMRQSARPMGERQRIVGRRKGGEEFPIEASIASSELDGELLFAVVLRDVSERKRAEEALGRSERQFRALLEGAREGVLIADDAGALIDVNPAICALFGQTKEALAGTLRFSRILPSGDSDPEQAWQRFLERGSASGRVLVYPFGHGARALEVNAVANFIPGHHMAVVRDITEQLEQEETLRRSEEGLALAQQVAHMGSFEWDLKHDVRRWSDETYRILGYWPREVEPSRDAFMARIHPEDQARIAEEFRKGLETGRPGPTEYRIQRPDGSICYVFSASTVTLDDQGRPARWLSTILDITARKRMEMALRESEERFRSAYEHAPIGMALVRPDGKFLQVNHALCAIVGYSRDELISRTFQEITHPADLEADLANARKLFAGEITSFRMEKRYLHKDGHVVWIQLTRSLVRTEGVEPLYGIAQVEDIGDRKQAELAQRLLAEAGSLLASTLDPVATLARILHLAVPSLADWCEIYFLGHEGRLEQVEVLAADPGKERILRELIEARPQERHRYGDTVAQVLISGQAAVLEEVTDEMLSTWIVDERPAAPLKQLGLRSLMAVPLRARGHTLGAVVLASSESGRRYDARDLALADELAGRAALALDNACLYQASEQATRTRDDVLRVVAHDLRSPLTSISLTAQLLRRRLPEAERSRPEAIVKAVEQANRLIQDLLDVARMEAGRLTVDQRPEEIDPLVRDCVEALRAQMEAKSITHELSIPPGLPSILVDRDRMIQILSNLLGNAIKFTPAGGHLELSATHAGDQVRFSLRDSGPGISAADLPHLFEPFWQAHNRKKEGAGLGLPIVKGLVEAHGGRIWVESRIEAGSTFFFTVPTALPALASA